MAPALFSLLNKQNLSHTHTQSHFPSNSYIIRTIVRLGAFPVYTDGLN